MKTLGIDIETRSSVSLDDAGVYAYSQAPDFTILLLSYSIDKAPAICVDLANGEELPDFIFNALFDKSVIKTAHNAMFEIEGLNVYYDIDLPVEQWVCTRILCAYLSLPLSLEEAGAVLNLPTQKDKRGKALIRYFCIPCKPNKKNNYRTINLPEHDPVAWAEFKQYNITDVNVEQAVREKILRITDLPEKEKRLWALDQKINKIGVNVDWYFVDQAMRCDKIKTDILFEECKKLTGLQNPNSVKQLVGWLNDELEDEDDYVEIKSINKDFIPAILEMTDSVLVNRVIEIRKETSRASIKKYGAMKKCKCIDGRIHGQFQFYGAGTGRWAARLTQLHNLRKNDLKDLDLARNLVRDGSFEMLELLFGDTSDVVSQLIRTAFIPKPGYKFSISDFTSIEAIITAWLANERWRLETFRKGIDIYKASYSQMFNKPLIEITKEDRQRGKVSELSLGYQGGVKALIKMGALKMGLMEEELQPIVYAWRNASPNIVKLWKTLNWCAVEAVRTGNKIPGPKNLVFYTSNNVLFIQLPSGRKLAYPRPKITTDNYGNDQVCFEGRDDKGRWTKQYLYGGLITENVVQAIARDVLAEKMLLVDLAGFDIVLHVHDEIVIELLLDESSERFDKIMNLPVSWAPGLFIKAVTFENMYYKKD